MRLSDWFAETAPKHATLTIFDEALTDLAQWDLTALWPSEVAWSINESDVVVEKVTFVADVVARTR